MSEAEQQAGLQLPNGVHNAVQSMELSQNGYLQL
jgi:hypothetical protein